jgi:serine/threonine-protein kinase RsbW
MLSRKPAGRRDEGGKENVETVTVSIPSRLELLFLLDKLSDSIAQQMEFGDEDRAAISMSVIEAGTNAIQHGHRLKRDQRVDVRFEIHPEQLEVLVSDFGPGFNLQEKVHDITAPEHLLDERGRGIFIMQTCMDQVDFDMSGGRTTVRLVKRRRSSPNGSEPPAS